MANTTMNKERVAQLRKYLNTQRIYADKMVEMYECDKDENKARYWRGCSATYNEIECLLIGNYLFDSEMDIYL